jgi:hypothetical protein
LQTIPKKRNAYLIPTKFDVGNKVFPLLQERSEDNGLIHTRWYVGDADEVQCVCPEISSLGIVVCYKLSWNRSILNEKNLFESKQEALNYIIEHKLNDDFDEIKQIPNIPKFGF